MSEPNVVQPSFATEDDAFEWLEADIEDCCIDNHRFAFVDDAEAMAKYEEAADLGCCGSADAEVIVAGRQAMIGCNYGH